MTTSTGAGQATRGRLKIAAAVPSAGSTFGFLLVIALCVVLGMGTVMIITTQVGAQSRELTALRREATTLSYEESGLIAELQEVASPGSLAVRARQLGMVPNPFPAFVDLPSGQVLGEPKTVTGDEAPYITGSQNPTPTPEASPTPEPTPTAEASPQPTQGEGA